MKSHEMAQGGTDGQYAWTVDEATLPPGLVARSKGGQLVIAGVPTEAGAYEILFEVRNAPGQVRDASLILYVN